MAKTAIISVDGHVKGSRSEYREYIPKEYLDVYDEQVKAAEEAGMRDAGNLHPEFDPEVQWDSDLRIEMLESIGVVAEVLFPNGQPFQLNRLDDFATSANVELGEVGRQVVQPLARRLLRAGAGTAARSAGDLLRRCRSGGRGGLLGEGARPRRDRAARSHPRRPVLLRPRTRPDLGRVRGDRTDREPARRRLRPERTVGRASASAAPRRDSARS